MRRGPWLSLALVIAVLGMLFTGQFAAALPAPAFAEPVTVAAPAAAPDNPGSSDATGGKQQPGPNLDQQKKDADAKQAGNKAIVAVVAAVLLVIVYFGHRSKSRYRIKLKNLQNAKG